jgi:hypothetical protein
MEAGDQLEAWLLATQQEVTPERMERLKQKLGEITG